MSSNQGWYGRKNSPLTVGQRLVFLKGAFPDDHHYDLKEGKAIDLRKRQGVVYDIHNDFDPMFIIVLDFPLNNTPTSPEFEYSVRHNLPGHGRQTLFIRMQQLETLPYSRIRSDDKYTSPCPMHRCFKCGALKRKDLMVEFNDLGCVCIKDIIPYKEELCVPDVLHTDVNDLLSQFRKLHPRVDPVVSVWGPSDRAITKALIHAKSWSRVPKSNRHLYFSTHVDKSYFEFSGPRGLSLIDVSEFDDQLFQTKSPRERTAIYQSWRDINSSSENDRNYSEGKESEPTYEKTGVVAQAGASPRKKLPPHLQESLRNFDFSQQDIQLLLDHKSQEEINSIDEMQAVCSIIELKENIDKNGQSLDSTNPNPKQKQTITSPHGNQNTPTRSKIGILLPNTISVTFSYPMLILQRTVTLPQGMDFNGIVAEASLPFANVNFGQGNELLLYLTPDLLKITATKSDFHNDKQRYCPVDQIVDKSVILVRNSLDNVGIKCSIDSLAAEYRSISIVQKITDLAQVFDSWRSVRGDGNCYYRAVMFSIMEILIKQKNYRMFEELSKRFQDVKSFETSSQSLSEAVFTVDGSLFLTIDNLCQMLQFAANGAMWTSYEEFECEILDSSKGLDLVFIRACRLLVSKYLLENANTELNGLRLEDAILPSYPDVSDMKAYCEKYVTAMGEDAEGPLISLGVLPLSLSCSSVTVSIDRREDVMTNVFVSRSPDSQQLNAPMISLLLRPGHYDVLYMNESYRQDDDNALPELTNRLNKRQKSNASDPLNPSQPNELASTESNQMKNSKQSNSYFIQSFSSSYRLVVENVYRDEMLSEGILMHHQRIDSDVPSLHLLFICASSIEELKENYSSMIRMSASRIERFVDRDMKNECLAIESITRNQVIVPIITNVVTITLINAQAMPSSIAVTIDVSIASMPSLQQRIGGIWGSHYQSSLIFHQNQEVNDLFELIVGEQYEIIEAIQTRIKCFGRPDKTVVIHRKDSYDSIMEKMESSYRLSREKVDLDCIHPYRDDLVIRIDSKTLINEIFDKLRERYYFRIAYCDCIDSEVTSCPRIFNEFVSISYGCGHLICMDCINQNLDSLPSRPIVGAEILSDIRSNYQSANAMPPSTSIKSSIAEVCSIFSTPDEKKIREGFLMPQLRTILCPVRNCNVVLSDKTLSKTKRYGNDMYETLFEMERYHSHLQSHRKCGLSGTICGPELSHLNTLIQLGCEDFFHFDCLATYLKHQISNCKQALSDMSDSKGRMTQNPFLCPVCADSGKLCLCVDCEETRVHVISQHETRALLDRDDTLKAEDAEDLDKLLSMLSMRSDYEDVVKCNKGGCHEYYLIRRSEKVLHCVKCNSSTCLMCKSDAHPNLTCEEAENERNVDSILSSGTLLQRCPKCFTIGTVPSACYHITCNKQCGHQFCFLCVASHTPTTAHSTSYHRRQCSFFTECCTKKCTIDGQKETCELSEFKPGPCRDCRRNHTTNQCTHIPNWKPCSSCVNKNQECFQYHVNYCVECDALGELCKPPKDLTDKRFKLIAKAEADEHQARMRTSEQKEAK